MIHDILEIGEPKPHLKDRPDFVYIQVPCKRTTLECLESQDTVAPLGIVKPRDSDISCMKVLLGGSGGLSK